jgi:hypothetical protein
LFGVYRVSPFTATANFEVQVWPCAGSGVTRRGDNISSLHLSTEPFMGFFLQVIVDSVEVSGVAEDEDVSA